MNKKHLIAVLGIGLAIFITTNWLFELTPLFPSDINSRRENFFVEHVDNYKGKDWVLLCGLRDSYSEQGWPFIIRQSIGSHKSGPGPTVNDISGKIIGCPEISSTVAYRKNELLNYLLITALVAVLTGGGYLFMKKRKAI